MSIFILMFPFFILLSFFFFFVSFNMLFLNFSYFFSWNMYISSFYVSFPLYFDYISCIFLGMVLMISGSILFYSHFYMEGEVYKSRFFYLMFLFVVSMIFLILCPNFFCMLLGWDGLGLISYCLVIYYQNVKSYSSGMITALTNRVGDVFILATIAMFFSMGSWSYMNFTNFFNSDFFILMFFIASLTKSAQVPFSAWLPAAMAAPTPVSSLVHSSTLVTAGVYILIRFNYFFSEDLKFYLLCISLMTMVMSGISGLFEFDLKKIIALSTLSQLGFMMATISLNYSNLAFFHLITHASFKALLFMCAGMFIHYFFDNQDIRSFGLMNKNFSFSLSMFFVANLSLCGFPFLSGFFSKDLILELFLLKSSGIIFFSLIFLGTFLTVFYTFRLIFFLSFKGAFFMPLEISNNKMGIEFSMIFLFFFSIFLGYFGSVFFLFPFNYIVMPLNLKLFVSILCLVSFFLCYILCKNNYLFRSSLVIFFSQMWFLHFLKTDFIKKYFFSFSFFLSKSITGFVESFFGFFVYKELFYISFYLNKMLKSSFVIFLIFVLSIVSLWMLLIF
uniref:NADH-ubiquinone oxidoreductase chain 5 n=1 Tax=Thrips hawaiiensis TaxID=163894 RepID=A0A8A0Y0K5_9NEOP|nr:NADH dehydrogenase subunit 5 [Thrips hawaiiensis]QSQ87289.1 NADH dehydrogenase subunit 5 [Thrips hawaiiensis]